MTAPARSLTAPLQIELQFELDVSPETAFDLVARRLPEWFTDIHAVAWDHEKSTRPGEAGTCSERTCDFRGKQLKEVIARWEPGKAYSYRADLERSSMKMPLEDHLGSFELEPVSAGTRVVWKQHFRAKWFVPAAMLRWQMRDRMMRPAIDKLIAQVGGRWC